MSLEVAGKEATTQVMDHHGLVAATCRDLKIAERINKRIGSSDPRRVVQPGVAAVAMVINGLGFTNRRLYLTPQFFQSKAIEFLFEEKITAESLDDHALGKALDEISAYGASRLYGELAFELGIEEGLLGKLAHLDTTSFSLHGQYDTDENVEVVDVTHGYSKDHRPDLKQVMLSLTMTGASNMPVWMEPQDGNSSDKTSFHETISRVREFQENLKQNHEFRWIADSALYTAEKLLSNNNYKWISRVPENIKECRTLLEADAKAYDWQQDENGYQWTEISSKYGGIDQRWLLVYSKQAYERESKTFVKKLQKQKAALEKDCWHLSNQVFNCESDAQLAVKKLQKKYSYHIVSTEVLPIERYDSRGRPSAGTAKKVTGYQVKSTIKEHQSAIEKQLLRKGRFMLATNDLDQEGLPAQLILQQYKQQQNVEGGFRFLKDPWFMLDSFYVKKRSRIEALMMVMTLCLLVYNVAQHRLREALKAKNETIPNQINKPVKNPTLKWVFQIMEGIGIVKLYDAASDTFRSIITNLDPLRCKIIRMMGESACKIYGITEKFAGT